MNTAMIWLMTQYSQEILQIHIYSRLNYDTMIGNSMKYENLQKYSLLLTKKYEYRLTTEYFSRDYNNTV